MSYKYGAFGRFKQSRGDRFLCKKCRGFKQKSEFFKSNRNPCGMSHACKICMTLATKKWRSKNKEKMVVYALRWGKNHPIAYEAHRLVKNAIKNKTLIRRPCEECGGTSSQAHHDDYSAPLRVKWLCPLHHVQRHKMMSI